MRKAIIASLIGCLCTIGCGGGGGGSDTSSSGSNEITVQSTFDQATDSNGEARVAVSLPSGTNKFMVMGTSDVFVSVDNVVGSDGTVYVDWQSPEVLAATLFYEPLVTTINVPSRGIDPQVNGGNFVVQDSAASTVRSDGSFVPARNHNMTFTLVGKQDPNLNGGVLHVNIFRLGGAADAQYDAPINAAIEEWRRIYRGASIELDVTNFSEPSGPSVIPDPTVGSPLFAALTQGADAPAVDLCIGLDVNIGEGAVFGVSPSIPGPPMPSPRSCLGVSVVNNAGGDGVFSDDDLRLFGETLAHETGHYLGLFHPVETDWQTYDPLPDTPTCIGQTQCDSVLGSNFMFPIPITIGPGQTEPQGDITGDQSDVMNRYIAVD